MIKCRKQILSIAIMFALLCNCASVFAYEANPPNLYENSWRYENGNLIENDAGISLFTTYSPWSKTADGFVNDLGEVIEGATLKGIDVSHHQGVIDWPSVKNSDVDYAIIRCGYGDDLTQYDDAYWKTNADACTDLDIPFGAYLYSYASSIEEAESEAAHAIRLLEGYDLDYPIYLDLEDNKTVATCSNDLIGQMAKIFCDALQEEGYKVGIYANKNWWDNKLTSDVFLNSSWYKWVAQYNSYCTYGGNYTMWQATSSGSVPGISGNVDINFWFGDITVIPPTDDTTDYSFPNTYENTGIYENDIVGVAETQLGYTELTNKNGTPVIDSEIPYYTKYGEKYGNPNGHWCAFFVLWCAEQANIPTSIICKSSSCGNCHNFTEWFKSNHRWKDNSYIPQKGDIVFFDWETDGRANHVGIVTSADENYVYTIEGNTGGENGYMVMRRERNENIYGFGVPDYNLRNKINGYASSRNTAYMLPDSNSSTVWEIWQDDELQVLCKDGDYYLVLYPYVYTGKFVAAYVPVSSVDINGSVAEAADYYSVNIQGFAKEVTTIYHNPSTDDLMGTTANYKVRATLDQYDEVTVLFEDSDFYFIRTDEISGYVQKNGIVLTTHQECVLGDVNGDSKIDSADAGLILRYDAGIINLVQTQIDISDINKDGKVDSADAGLILRYDAGIIQNFN